MKVRLVALVATVLSMLVGAGVYVTSRDSDAAARSDTPSIQDCATKAVLPSGSAVPCLD